MKPSEIAITVDSLPPSPTSSDYEKIDYPGYPSSHTATDWAARRREEELPLHYMTEETARRRVARGHGHPTAEDTYADEKNWQADDQGKDVYAKASSSIRYGAGGRVRRAPPPPPTSIVRRPCFGDCFVGSSVYSIYRKSFCNRT